MPRSRAVPSLPTFAVLQADARDEGVPVETLLLVTWQNALPLPQKHPGENCRFQCLSKWLCYNGFPVN
jgi:hypothetical protein